MLENPFDNGKLAKMIIQAYLPADPEGVMELSEAEEDKYVVQVNPETYSVNYKVNYDRRPAIGNSGSEAKYTNTTPPTLNFEFIFDGTGVIPASAGPLDGVPIAGAVADLFSGDEEYDVVTELQKFTKVVDYNGQEHQPRRVRLTWGKLIFDGVLSQLSVDYKLFKPDGTPLRAIAKAAFEGTITDLLRERQENNSSPDLTHLREVIEGDKLPLMSHRIYRQAKYYIEVARRNKLYNFRNLNNGQKLSFPPLEKKSK
ncbi:MAG: LysM peptidoglycan-binding domain-containing protein [Bacteroidota bacterium]